MNIKAKSTAVAIATVSSVLSFSVPSQASEYGYLNIIKIDAEQMSEQEGVNHYLDELNVSEKLERGKEYCKALEGKTMEKVIRSLGPKVYNLSQQGYSERAIDGFINTQLSMLYASAKELCPEYEYKLDIFQSKHSGEK
jgi:ribosomal protein L12E/L44/L45/RPP1/RPP2